MGLVRWIYLAFLYQPIFGLPSQPTFSLPSSRLTFRDHDGSKIFKLTVFSDLHFGENDQFDVESVKLMSRMLREEQPDFVVINGDLVTGERVSHDTIINVLLPQLLGPLNEAGVPFSTTGGNHDNQRPITHLDLILAERRLSPFLSHTAIQVGSKTELDAYGPGNYWVPVYADQTSVVPALVLWFFDSRGGVDKDGNDLEDFVDPAVARWIQHESEIMDKLWGCDRDTAALAFVHIPPNIIQTLHPDPDRNPGLNANVLGQGSVQDHSNSAKDKPFWDALTSPALIPNLKAVVSGHVHGNEWCKRQKDAGAIFCFSKHTGYGGYDDPSWSHGVRNMFFSSANASSAVETWIKLEDGQERARVTLDESYFRNSLEKAGTSSDTLDSVSRKYEIPRRCSPALNG